MTAAYRAFESEASFETSVQPPGDRRLLGFDVVTYEHGNAPCHSPLTCNGLAQKLPVNRYGLLATCDEAKLLVEAGAFTSSEPGPHRILAVYSV